MSIRRLPNWQIPDIKSSIDDPESLKEVIEWLRIHHIEHDEESANVALDFEKMVVDTIYPTNIVTTNVTVTNITIAGTTANRLLATDGSNVAGSTDLYAWVAGTTNQVNITNDNDGTITLSLPQNIHASASPIFVTAKLSALTDGYVPYHVSDATGLADSIIFYDGMNVGIGLDANQKFEIGSADNSNRISLYHDNTDAYFKTDDGAFIFQTTEGTDTDTAMRLKPKGNANVGYEVWDRDGSNFGSFWQGDGATHINSASNDPLHINRYNNENVKFFEGSSGAGLTKVEIYGHTARAETNITMYVAGDGDGNISLYGLNTNELHIGAFATGIMAFGYEGGGNNFYARMEDGNSFAFGAGLDYGIVFSPIPDKLQFVDGHIMDTNIRADMDSTGLFTFYESIALKTTGEIRFYDSDNSHHVGFEAPALSADQIWVLPDADGNANDILQTSGGGVLSWVTVPGGTFAGLSDTDINDTVAYVDGQIAIYEASADKWYNRTMSGDVTISDTGVTIVANDSHTHSIYSLVDGTRAFTGVVGGIAPTSAAHLATKEYVDDSIGIVLDYHFNNTTANIDQETETTYNMESIQYAGEENITRTAITAASNQLLYCFATIVGEPGGIDLPHGEYDTHFHLETSTAGGARTVDVYWTLSSVDADGTNESEPPIMTSETVAGVTGGETAYTIHAHLDADVNVGSASRLLLKVYGNGNAGSNTIMQFHVEGDTGTHFTMKATSAIFNTIYVRQDGTTPLTANWDVGNYTLTANGITIDGTFTDGTLSISGGNLENIVTATFISEVTATPSAAFTVDWTTAMKQRVTITGVNLDITFTNPGGPCDLTLVIVQGDGDDTIDWTNEVDILFPGGTDPTLSVGAGDIDIVTFYFDGTNYFATTYLDFQ